MTDGGGNSGKKVAMVVFSEDIVTEILLRLPVKSLLKFKTVCKSWYSIINSTMFVRDHLKRAHAARYNQHKNLLGILDAILFKEDADGVMHAKEFDFPTKNLAGTVEKISTFAHNSCDGLICFQMEPSFTVVLWNPSLPTEYKVIDVSCFSGNCALGYDPRTDDYKIVCVPFYSVDETPCAYIEVPLFSLKRDSWRSLRITKTMDYQIENTKMIYTKNRLHWLGAYYRYTEYIIEYDVDDDDDYEFDDDTFFIVYFDLVEESLHYLNLPSPSDRFVIPLNYKDSLGIAFRNLEGEEEFWVLQDYCGMNSAWSKIFKISCPCLSPLDYCFTLKGELLMCDENGLAIVDAKDGSYNVREVDYDDEEENYLHIFTSPYVESLVSPTRLQ